WWHSNLRPACSRVGRPFVPLISETVGPLRFRVVPVIIVLHLSKLAGKRIQNAVGVPEDCLQLLGRRVPAWLPQSVVDRLVYHHQRASESVRTSKPETCILVWKLDTGHADLDVI